MGDRETKRVCDLRVPEHAGQQVTVYGRLIGFPGCAEGLGTSAEHSGVLVGIMRTGTRRAVGLVMEDEARAVLCHPTARADLEAPSAPVAPSVALHAMDLCRPEIGRRVRVHGYRLRSTGHDFEGPGEHEGELVSVTRLDDSRAVVVLDDRRDGVRVVSCGLRGSVFVLRSTPAEVPAPLRLAWGTRRSHAKLTGSGDIDHCAVLAQAMQDAGYEFAPVEWRQKAGSFETAIRDAFELAKHSGVSAVRALIDLADEMGVIL
jgi:hypothetical protein